MKRGKKPKERERYILRVQNGELLEVTREVYLEWYQSRRREKYQRERDQKYGVCSLDAMGAAGIHSPMSVHERDGLEELVLQKLYLEELQKALRKLEKQDAYLIYLLYYEGITMKAAAERCQCSRTSIRNRQKHILDELRQVISERGIEKDG